MRALSLYVKTIESIKARRTEIEQEAHLLKLIDAREFLLSARVALQEFGLTSGVFDISESAEDDYLYAINVESSIAPDGMDGDAFVQAIEDAVDKRELADGLTSSGCGEFFHEKINIATFYDDRIAPIEVTLRGHGVEV